MVDALKFRRLVACQKGYTKNADPDQTASKTYMYLSFLSFLEGEKHLIPKTANKNYDQNCAA